MSEEKLILNVGGTRFATLKKTLTTGRAHNTRLAAIASEWNYTSVNWEAGEHFLDKNPHVFSCILDYLRHGTLDIVGCSLNLVEKEAGDWGLEKMLLAIRERKREMKEKEEKKNKEEREKRALELREKEAEMLKKSAEALKIKDDCNCKWLACKTCDIAVIAAKKFEELSVTYREKISEAT